MIRVGVLSDSHGDHDALDKLIGKMGRMDAVCFLGDIASDVVYLRGRLACMPRKTMLYAVRGNNDWASSLPDELLCEIGAKHIYMEHGHRCPSLMTLAHRAKDRNADIALFGHTHAPYCEYVHGILLLNPGSAGNYCRGGRARANVLEIGERLRVIDVTL